MITCGAANTRSFDSLDVSGGCDLLFVKVLWISEAFVHSSGRQCCICWPHCRMAIQKTLHNCRCGSAEGLDAGRHCLQQWGFRRCEDICWIKTNKEQRRAASVRQDTQAVLQHTKVLQLCRHTATHPSFLEGQTLVPMNMAKQAVDLKQSLRCLTFDAESCCSVGPDI